MLVGKTDNSIMHGKEFGTSIRLMTINNSGEMIKSVLIGNPNFLIEDSAQIARNINHCNNGGILIATRTLLTLKPNHFRIIKLDSNYCDTNEAYCRMVELGVNEKQIFKIQDLLCILIPGMVSSVLMWVPLHKIWRLLFVIIWVSLCFASPSLNFLKALISVAFSQGVYVVTVSENSTVVYRIKYVLH